MCYQCQSRRKHFHPREDQRGSNLGKMGLKIWKEGLRRQDLKTVRVKWRTEKQSSVLSIISGVTKQVSHLS